MKANYDSDFKTGARLVLDHVTKKGRYSRITESWNGRGWKGPLWVI